MPEDLIGKELLGQFRIVERIGRGGMGEVYKAEQPAMDRLVAIKILHSKLAARQDLVSRFRREARAMSRLSHPNTARVFLYGQLEESNQLYIVMEYLDGIDLARHVRRHGPMEATRAAKVMIQVLGALEEAHSVGVIHRDLKPENILLGTRGGLPDFPKVLDFGLAKVHETRPRPGSLVLTREGMIFGTPEFMSPEQARGKVLDAKSDVYSAGLIFYELVTGQLPFPKCKPMEYIAHHIHTEPVPITERVPGLDIPPVLKPIVAMALEKDLAKRYQSAREFGEALKTVLPQSGRSVSVRALQPKPSEPPPRSTTRVDTVDSKIPERAAFLGKGVLIGLLVLILILLVLVVWLLSTRPGEPAQYVPIDPQVGEANPESPPPRLPPSQSPSGAVPKGDVGKPPTPDS